MSTENVIIKGVRDGMLILLDDGPPWNDVLSELGVRLEEQRSFFRGASVTANLGERIIDEPEWSDLLSLFAPHEIELNLVVSGSNQSRSVAAAHGVSNRPPSFAQRGDTLAEAVAAAGLEPASQSPGRIVELERRRRGRAGYATPERESPRNTMPLTVDGEPDFLAIASDPEAEEADGDSGAMHFGDEYEQSGALFLRRTLRSGMSVRHKGDVCILGDVNAGAEVVSGGDIVVWGSLRGLVHAGYENNSAAVVAALQLAPTQLRIAGILSRAPGDDPAHSGAVVPEIARVEGERIVVDAWSPRRARTV